MPPAHAQDTKGALDILTDRTSIRFTRKPPLPLSVDSATGRILISLDAEALPSPEALPGGQAMLDQLLSRTFKFQAILFSQVREWGADLLCNAARRRPALAITQARDARSPH